MRQPAEGTQKSEVFKLLCSINERLKEDSRNGLNDSVLSDVFDDAWAKLDNKLVQIEYARDQQGQPQRRNERELLEEVLELVIGYQVQIEALKYEMNSPSYFRAGQKSGITSSLQKSGITSSLKELPYPEPGREVEAIHTELQKANHALLRAVIEAADSKVFFEGDLYLNFPSETAAVRRLKASEGIFHNIGLRLFDRPIRLIIKTDPELPHDNDIPF